MGQFVHNGVIYEELPNGQAKVIGPASGGTSAIGPVIGGNPLIPGQLQQQQSSELRANQAEARAQAAAAREAAAWNASHNPDGTPKVQAPSLLGDPNKTGPEYLATLPQNIRNRVQQLIDGRSQLTAREKGTPLGQQLMDAANQADPTFDENASHARYLERQQYTGQGKGSLTVQAAERLAQHVNDLYSASKDLGGPDLRFTPLSNLANATTNSFRQSKVARYNQILPLISGELQKLTKNGSATVDESDKIEHNLQANQPEDVRYAAIKEVVRLGRAQYDPLRESWASAWQGATPPPMPMDFSKATTSIFDNIEAGGKPLEMKRDKSGNLIVPPPTGPTSGSLTPSTNGFNDTPDPQSADFWANSARQGTSYRDALHQWQSDVKARGLVGITPPPPEAYHKAAEYIRDHPNVPYQPFSGVIHTPINPLQQAGTDAAFSGPAVALGHAANEFAGTLPTALAGDQGARYNAVSNATHPNYALGGDIAGTIAGAVGAGKIVNGVAPNLGRLGGMLAGTPGRAGLTGDLLYGGTSGAAQNPDNPILGAGEGMAAMGAGNVAGRYLLAPVIRGGAKAVNKAAGMFGATPLDIPEALQPGQNMLFNRANPAINDIRSNLQDAANLNLPYSLADASPKLRMLAGQAVRKSQDVRTLAENTLNPRQMGQGERAISLIDQHLAPVGDVPSMKADAISRAQAAAKPLYAKALSHPAPNDPHIMEMLDTPAGQTAARNAYSIALNSGESPAELSFATDRNGEPVIKGLPNWKTLQYIKMGLDKVVTDNQNPVTGKLDLADPANRALNDLRSRFVSRLGDLNPDYRAANEAYGNIAGQGTSVERGAAATSPRVTPEQAQIAVTNAGNNLPHFQRGYASNMADQVERSRLSGDPYNLIYGSMGQQAKIGTVFPQGAQTFGRARALEGDMSSTAHETLGGSPTAARMEADKQFANPMGDAALELGIMAATGVPPKNLIMGGLRKFADARDFGLRGAKAKADQLGPMLLNTDPMAGIGTLDELQRIALLRRGYVDKTRAIGGMFGAPLIGGPLIYGGNQ